ncbi:MAG: restriction endonuclease subunit R, partial [Candidatus Eisenbacteria bacterium]|nr:restriction endonuclease subunit R [Candidatus Eisenbacteria bacterium]
EKIRIQKETIRKADLGNLFSGVEDQARTEIANLRLQGIASLPHLAVFSDEAHHTYGQSLDSELKKVRKTVDYLAASTNVICVVNTTGTPYFQRQPLRDVVIWYGLSQGIRDNILKDVAGNIQSYDFAGDAKRYVAHVVNDFFRDYGQVTLPNGAPAKLALYFPQTDDLKQLRPAIDRALVDAGHDPSVALVNTSDESLTRQSDIDAFNRLNDPAAPHRVILLVNKGTEGWNCPSLFACALARKLKTSNNFVLQAATRCLRQVPGNAVKARVYLSTENFGVLDRQLQETYGETITDLNHAAQETRRARIVLRKLAVPPLVVTQLVRTVVKKEGLAEPLRLKRTRGNGREALTRRDYTVAEQRSTYSVLRQLGEGITIDTVPDLVDAYTAAVDLAARYRLDVWAVYDELRRLYGTDDMPATDLQELAKQIEEQTRFYEVKEERVDVALALVKPEGFARDVDASGAECYTAEIMYPKDRERLLLSLEAVSDQNPAELGFHYDPYDFDSNPEKSFFEQMLVHVNVDPKEVEDIYFTGGLTDPAKTDFFVQYRDEESHWRRYSPDFVIRKKPKKGGKPGSGRVLIVEIKDARFRAATEEDLKRNSEGRGAITVEGRKAIAVRQWQKLNPDRLRYQIIFAGTDTVPVDSLQAAMEFVEGDNPTDAV